MWHENWVSEILIFWGNTAPIYKKKLLIFFEKERS